MSVDAQIDKYFADFPLFEENLKKLRQLLKSTELIETVKWGLPTYVYNQKNLIGLGAFKEHCGLWFFQGALLKDPEKLLSQAQKKTAALRQMKFSVAQELNEEVILSYIRETIENAKANKSVAIEKNKELEIPDTLNAYFKKNPDLKVLFDQFKLTPKREFVEYLWEAKQEKTRLKRLEKVVEHIRTGVGLNDKYRN